MIIRTSDLLNHLRCRRFSALSKIQLQDHDKVDQPFDIESLEGQSHIEGENNKQTNFFVSDFFSYKQLFEDHYLKNLPYPFEKNQKVQKFFENDFILETNLEYSTLSTEKIAIFKTSLSTSNHFLSMKYTHNKKKYPLFVKNEQGIYKVRHQKVVEGDHTNYFDRLKRCLSRHYDTGRLVYDLGFSYFTLPKEIKSSKIKMMLVTLNNDYVIHHETLSQEKHIDELFCLFDFTDLVISLQEKIQADLYRVKNLIELSDDSPCDLVEEECLKDKPFECRFTSYCFSHIPKKTAITNYFYSHLGFKEGPHKNDPQHETYDLINQGLVDMQDIPISWLQREKNLMQRYCVDNDYEYINKVKIKAYLKQLKYPYYFLDFEAFPSPIPRFYQEKPYSQSVFQYSLHIRENQASQELIHDEFLAEDHQDHRLELLEALLDKIGDKGSIIVYNKTFEKSRLQELAMIYPQHHQKIESIISRMFDLYLCLKNDQSFFLENGFSEEASMTYNYYHPLQAGSYSIKTILKVMGNRAYDKLEIQNGTMAYEFYIKMANQKDEDREKIRKNLLLYCELDTYAMVFILDRIISML